MASVNRKLSVLSDYQEVVRLLETTPVRDVESAIMTRSIALIAKMKQAVSNLAGDNTVIQEAVVHLRTLAMPSILHHGLLNLPPEILARIARFTHLSDRRPYPVFPLVCRRFREIELSDPEFWTFVSGKMSPERMALQIERAGGMGMTFEMIDGGEEYWGCDCRWICRCDTWAVIASNPDRWTSVRILLHFGSLTEEMFGTPVMAPEGSGDPEEHILCPHKLRGITFPNLERLDLDIREECTDGISYIKTWILPKLKHLTHYVHHELTVLDTAVAISLRDGVGLESFKLKISWSALNAQAAIDWVSELFPRRNFAKLLRLELVISHLWEERPTLNSAQASPVTPTRFKPLCFVKHFALVLRPIRGITATAERGESSYPTLKALLPHLPLLTPNALSIAVSAPYEFLGDSVFEDYLVSLRSLHPSLKEVRVTLWSKAASLDRCETIAKVRSLLLKVQSKSSSSTSPSDTSSQSPTLYVNICGEPLHWNVSIDGIESIGFDEEVEDWCDYSKPHFGPSYIWSDNKWIWKMR